VFSLASHPSDYQDDINNDDFQTGIDFDGGLTVWGVQVSS